MNNKIITKLREYLLDTNECINYPILNKEGYGIYQQ